MNYLLIALALLVGMAALTSLLCAPQYREEDRRRSYENGFKISSLSKPQIYATWITAAFVALMMAIFFQTPEAIVAIGTMGVFAQLLCLGIGFWRRDSYYTTDKERFTYIRHGMVQWSYEWKEVAHVYRRVVSTGKVTYVLYDLYLNDGTVHKNLPSTLGRVLKEHVPIEHHPINWKRLCIILLVILAAIACMGLTGYMATSLVALK